LKRSGLERLLREGPGSEYPNCITYYVDVTYQGRFSKPSYHEITSQNVGEFWCKIQAKRPEEARVRAIFIENMSGSVMQMLGTK